MKIITANYRDRDSSYKWLVREEFESIHEATSVKSLLAKNVTFSPAIEELSYGCDIVGQVGSEDIQVNPADPTLLEDFRRMNFASGNFSDSKNYTRVDEVSELYLAPDGKMWYKPAEAVSEAMSGAVTATPWRIGRKVQIMDTKHFSRELTTSSIGEVTRLDFADGRVSVKFEDRNGHTLYQEVHLSWKDAVKFVDGEGTAIEPIPAFTPAPEAPSFRLDDIAESGLKLAVRGTKGDEFLLWESDKSLYLTVNSFHGRGFLRAATAIIDSTTLQKLLLVVEQEEAKAAIEGQSAGPRIPEGFTPNPGFLPVPVGRLVEVIYSDGERALVSAGHSSASDLGFTRFQGKRFAYQWKVDANWEHGASPAQISFYRIVPKEEVVALLFPEPDANAGLDDILP